MNRARVTTEEAIAAYRETGSVWRAGQQLGIAGQTVHGKLRAAGVKTGNRWTEDEVARLREMVNTATIGQIADELGRSYAGIACKVNELGIGSNHGNRFVKKLPRGQGYDKASTKKHVAALESDRSVAPTKYARSHGMRPESFIRALEIHFPEWWQAYRESISYLPTATCPNCEDDFYPSNTKQIYCCRRCRERHAVDRDYFGGKRNTTIGLAEGVCQICDRSPRKGLSSHHVLGKENDPGNDFLVALCAGCHNVITALGARDLSERQWQQLISFAWLRKHGPEVSEAMPIELYVDVDIEPDFNVESNDQAGVA